jgi:hypothetical protein
LAVLVTELRFIAKNHHGKKVLREKIRDFRIRKFKKVTLKIFFHYFSGFLNKTRSIVGLNYFGGGILQTD